MLWIKNALPDNARRLLTCRSIPSCVRAVPNVLGSALVSAITGELKKPHTIDVSKCIKCGACKEGCPFHAIS